MLSKDKIKNLNELTDPKIFLDYARKFLDKGNCLRDDEFYFIKDGY